MKTKQLFCVQAMLPNRWTVVLSDLHLGAASCGTLDEFTSDDEFHRLLTDVIPNEIGWPATICLNGDFIDFTRLLLPLSNSQKNLESNVSSVRRLTAAANAHPVVFTALREFVQQGGHVTIVPGNHDAHFMWDGVFEELRNIIALDRRASVVRANECRVQDHGLLIEHGHQLTWDNSYFHWPKAFVGAGAEQRLEIPWGSRFMEVIYRELPEFQPYVYSVLDKPVVCRIIANSLFDIDGISRHVLFRMLPFFVRTFPEQLWRRCRTALTRHSPGEDVQVIIRGHTHIAEDRQIRVGTNTFRLLNPGSWLPRLQTESPCRLRFHNLQNAPQRKQLGYIVVDHEDLTAAKLCEIDIAKA